MIKNLRKFFKFIILYITLSVICFIFLLVFLIFIPSVSVAVINLPPLTMGFLLLLVPLLPVILFYYLINKINKINKESKIKHNLPLVAVKVLISLVISYLIIFSIASFVNIFYISSSPCCGLNVGDKVRWKEFDSSILQRGDVVFYKDSPKVYFSRIIAFPGEYVFSDSLTGRWGYLKSDIVPKMEMDESEVLKLFSDIVWLDYPTFQATTQSKNLYDRLSLISYDAEKYQAIGDGMPMEGMVTISINPTQIFGIYDSVLVTASHANYVYLAIIAFCLLLVVVIYYLLSLIFIKLKKRKLKPDVSLQNEL